MAKNKSIYILRRKQQVNILAMPQMSNRLYTKAFAENFLMGVCVCACTVFGGDKGELGKKTGKEEWTYGHI